MTFPGYANWTAERISQLTQLWAEGYSCSCIALQMGGVTRNAVIGKVHRLGLPHRRTAGPVFRLKPGAKPKPSIPRPSRAKRPKMVLYSKAPEPKPEPYTFSAAAWDPLPGTTPISLLQLSDGVCRWPVGGDGQSLGTGFCGCPVSRGSPYCPEHRARSSGKGTQQEQTALRSARSVSRYDGNSRLLEVA
jgi:GcrA cell cycle regulator